MLLGSAMAATALVAYGVPAVRRPDTVVPIERIPNQIVIRVAIGETELRFGLDSGSDEVRIHPFAAKRAGLTALPDEVVPWVRYHLKSDLRIGTLTVRGVPIEVRPLFVSAEGQALDHTEYDGLIGLELLRKHAWGIDLIDRKVAIWKGGRVDPASVASWTGAAANANKPVESRLLPTRGEPAWYVVERSPAEGGGRLILDLGSPMMMLRSNEVQRYGAIGLAPMHIKFLEGNGKGQFGLGTDVHFGWRTLPSPLVAILDEDTPENAVLEQAFTSRKVGGLVGWEAFSHARSVFDFPRQRVSVAFSPSAASLSDHVASFGLRLVGQESGFIACVRPGGAADRAGLKTMEMVEEVDGIPAATIAAEMAAPEGWVPKEALPVKVRRGEKTATLELRR